MATEALALAAAKRNQFRLEVNGIPVAMFQKAKVGAVETGLTKHWGAGQAFPVKESDGKVEFEPLEVENIVPIDGPGKQVMNDWIIAAVDWENGQSAHPRTYKRDASLFELGPKGQPLRVWELKGCWLRVHNPGELDESSSGEDANLIETGTIEYDWRTMDPKQL